MERQRIQSNDSAASNPESLAFSHLSGAGGEDMLRRQSSNSAFHASPSLAQNMSIFDSAAYSDFPDSPGSSVWNHARRTSSVGFDSEAMRHVGSTGAASSRYAGDESPADSAAMSVVDPRSNSMSERSYSHISNDGSRSGVISSPLTRASYPRPEGEGGDDDDGGGAGSDGSEYDEEHDAAVRAAAMDDYNREADRRHRNLGLNFTTPFDPKLTSEDVRTPGATTQDFDTTGADVFMNAHDAPDVPQRISSFGKKSSGGQTRGGTATGPPAPSSPEKASPRTPHANLIGLPASPSKSARLLMDQQQPPPRDRGLSDAATPRVPISGLPEESPRAAGAGARLFQAGPTVRSPASRDIPLYPASPTQELATLDGMPAVLAASSSPRRGSTFSPHLKTDSRPGSASSPKKASSPLAATSGAASMSPSSVDADLDAETVAALEAQLIRAADAAEPSRPRTLKEARALAKERSKLRQMAGGSSASSTMDSRPGTARPLSVGTATAGSRPQSRDEQSTPTLGHEGSASGVFARGHKTNLSSSSSSSRLPSADAPVMAPVRSSSPVKSTERPARDPKRGVPTINTSAGGGGEGIPQRAPPPRISTSSDGSESEYSKSSASDAILTPLGPTSSSDPLSGSAAGTVDDEDGVLRSHTRRHHESDAAEELADDGDEEDRNRLSANRRAKRYGQVSPRMGGSTDLPSGPKQMDELQAAVGDALADLSFGSSTTATGETAVAPSTLLGEAAIAARQFQQHQPNARGQVPAGAPPTALDTPRLAQMMAGMSVAREGSPGTDGTSRADTSFDSARESLPGVMGTSGGRGLGGEEGAQSAGFHPNAHGQGPDLAAAVYSPTTVAAASPRATPRSGSLPRSFHPISADAQAPVAAVRPTIYGKTARWPAAFDPSPIVSQRKAAPWDRAKAYAMAANELARTDTCLATWLLHVQRPAQAQLMRQNRSAGGGLGGGGAGGGGASGTGGGGGGGGGANKGWHAKESTDASYAASIRSEATFPMRGDGGRARETTNLASLSEDQPVPSLPSDLPYPGIIAATTGTVGPSSQNMAPSASQSSFYSASSNSNALPIIGMSRGASTGPGGGGSSSGGGGMGGGFFSSLGRKGSKKSPSSGSLGMAPLTHTSSSSSAPQAQSSGSSQQQQQQPRGPRGVKSRTTSSPLNHGRSPSLNTTSLPLASLDTSSLGGEGSTNVQESPTSVIQPQQQQQHNPPVSSISSIARANSMAAADQQHQQSYEGGHVSNLMSGGTLRAPMGPRAPVGMGSPSAASSASFYSAAAGSRRDSTSSARSGAGSSNHGAGVGTGTIPPAGTSGLGGEEKRGTFFGVTSGGGIYSTPRARSESKDSTATSTISSGLGSNGASPGSTVAAPTDYKKESAFDGRRRGSSSQRGAGTGTSPRPGGGDVASLYPGTNPSWGPDVDPTSRDRDQPSRSPTITRSSFSYGSVRNVSRSPATSVSTGSTVGGTSLGKASSSSGSTGSGGGGGVGGLKLPGSGAGTSNSGTGSGGLGLGLALVSHKLVGKRSGSFSSQGTAASRSPDGASSNNTPSNNNAAAAAGDAGFEEALSKLGDVLPDADSATLRHYLKKAGGNDLAAIGDYLQDQSLGKIVSPSASYGGGGTTVGGPGVSGARGRLGGWR